jgi:glycosyltransferase involved in cell wall biosynthesis
MNKKLSVICPTYRNSKYLDLFLKSAVEGKVLDSTEIFVSVDGFYDESAEVLNKYRSRINILDLGLNRGMASAINLAVYQAPVDTNILIINDDNVLNNGYDVALTNLDCEKTIYTIEQIEPTGPGMFNFITKDFGRTAETFEYEAFQDYCKECISNDWFSDEGRIFPFLISKKNFMIVNGFDTFYNSPNMVDWDFFLKCELLELKFSRIRSALFYHFGSVSTKKNAESEIFKNKEIKAAETFLYKWGVYPYNGMNNTKVPPNSWLSTKY